MKTDKILLYAVYGAGAYFLIRYVMKFYVKGRDKDVLDIVKQRYEGFDDKFLDAWANGVKSKMTQFPYEGKMYDVNTGKVVIK
jgi:hypothetical protein